MFLQEAAGLRKVPRGKLVGIPVCFWPIVENKCNGIIYHFNYCITYCGCPVL